MPTLAVGSLVIFCALCMVVMSCYGGGYGTISALVVSYFGAKGLGAVYASVFSAAAVASFGASDRRPTKAMRSSSWRTSGAFAGRIVAAARRTFSGETIAAMRSPSCRSTG